MSDFDDGMIDITPRDSINSTATTITMSSGSSGAGSVTGGDHYRTTGSGGGGGGGGTSAGTTSPTHSAFAREFNEPEGSILFYGGNSATDASDDIPGIGQYEDFHTIDWQRDIARDRMRHRHVVKKIQDSVWDFIKVDITDIIQSCKKLKKSFSGSP